jgi:short-subunit dehydrogenase
MHIARENPIMSPVALITGASQGSGRAIAQRFACEGYDLVLAARQADRLDAVAQEVRSLGRQVVALSTDVSDPSQVQTLVEAAIEQFSRVDVLVNNAGICLTGSFQNTTLQDWRSLFDTNLFGYVNTIQALIPHFLDRGSGAIVNLGSFGGKMPIPMMTAYCASKYAVTGLTQTLQLELEPHGISVSLVHPGVINSDFLERAQFRGDVTTIETSKARLTETLNANWVSQPEEIAAAVWHAVRDRRSEIVVGPTAIATEAYRLAPGLVSWAMRSMA